MTNCPACELWKEIEALRARLNAMFAALEDEYTCRRAEIEDVMKVLEAKLELLQRIGERHDR